MKKILIAMSGGVDSAAACALLRDQGYEVGGATMLLRAGGEPEVESARQAAERMQIPFRVFCWQEEFAKRVIAPFTRIYQQGGTPNPCVICNQEMKFGLFLQQALELGYDGIATGHYARVEQSPNGRWLLRRGLDDRKDQSYMLYGLSQHQLAHTLFPLGNLCKPEVRSYAEAQGLQLATKQDSQDICFVPDGDYMAYLTAHGMKPQLGRFLDQSGRDYGPHKGQEAYTIGQRRGLEVAAGSRIYVVEKRGADVILGPNEALFSDRVLVDKVNWISVPQLDRPMRLQARLRYTPKLSSCLVTPVGDGAELLFDEPQRAVTPGQAAVFYDGDLVVGGGTIRCSARQTNE